MSLSKGKPFPSLVCTLKTEHRMMQIMEIVFRNEYDEKATVRKFFKVVFN